jgi:hypothetical protein
VPSTVVIVAVTTPSIPPKRWTVTGIPNGVPSSWNPYDGSWKTIVPAVSLSTIDSVDWSSGCRIVAPPVGCVSVMITVSSGSSS